MWEKEELLEKQGYGESRGLSSHCERNSNYPPSREGAPDRTGSVIEILVLEALANLLQGDIPAALVPLQQALSLAEPEGYVRIFVDEGPPMAVLLEEAAKQGIAPHYVRHLLTAMGSAKARTPVTQGLI